MCFPKRFRKRARYLNNTYKQLESLQEKNHTHHFLPESFISSKYKHDAPAEQMKEEIDRTENEGKADR
jgi:cell division septum initiation protein DivIVA